MAEIRRHLWISEISHRSDALIKVESLNSGVSKFFRQGSSEGLVLQERRSVPLRAWKVSLGFLLKYVSYDLMCTTSQIGVTSERLQAPGHFPHNRLLWVLY